MSLDGFGVFAVSTGLGTESTRDNSLDGINTIVLKSGAFGWVQTGGAARTLFRLDREDNTTAPNGTTIIQPLTGPGRWKEFGNGGAVCLLPLFRAIYVDKNTTTLGADQNGSISCPFDRIQKALDTIPALVVGPTSAVLLDARQGFVILTAPGDYSSEVITFPSVGRMIILRALGGLALPTFNPLGPATGLGPIEGPPVLCGEITVDYSFLDGTTDQTSICPYYQFEGVFINTLHVIADAPDPDVMSGCVLSAKNCWVLEVVDDSIDKKFNGTYDFRESFLALMLQLFAGLVAERSEFGVIEIGRVRAEDSVFDDLLKADDTESLLTDCIVTTSYDSSTGTHDGVTEYAASITDALVFSSTRRVEDLSGNGYWKYVTADVPAGGFPIQPDGSWFLFNNPDAGPRTVLLQGLTGASGSAQSHPSAGDVFSSAASQMSRVVAVKNAPGSSGPITLDGQTTTTVDGGTLVLAVGEGAILIADGAANNWEVFATV